MERERLNSPECYHNSISIELRPKRDKMAVFLNEVGMVPTVPQGGYFMVADFSSLGTIVILFLFAEEFILNIRLFHLSLCPVFLCVPFLEPAGRSLGNQSFTAAGSCLWNINLPLIYATLNFGKFVI